MTLLSLQALASICQDVNCSGCTDVLVNSLALLQAKVTPLVSLIDTNFAQFKSPILTQLLNEGNLNNIPGLQPTGDLSSKFWAARNEMVDTCQQAQLVEHLRQNPGGERASVILEEVAKFKRDLARST